MPGDSARRYNRALGNSQAGCQRQEGYLLKKVEGPIPTPGRAGRGAGGWADAPENRISGLVLYRDKRVTRDPESCTPEPGHRDFNVEGI